jgi:hypothetical protein
MAGWASARPSSHALPLTRDPADCRLLTSFLPAERRFDRTADSSEQPTRKRSRVVLIRLGSRRDETYFSAGETRAYDNDGKPMPVLPAEDE